MNSILISTAILPGLVACLLFLLFTYLHEQSRQPYFRAWQMAWAAYTLHFLLDAWSAVSGVRAPIVFLSSLLLVAMALAILVSTRLTRRLTTSERREAFRLRWYEIVVAAVGVGFSVARAVRPLMGRSFLPRLSFDPLELVVALILGYSSLDFYRTARRRGSIAFRLLSFSLALWAVLTTFGQLKSVHMFGGDLLGPIPQMMLGLAMVMVLFENERNAVQENALAFSKLDVDPMRLLSANDLVAEHAKHSGSAGRAAADYPRGDLHFGALARSVAVGAAWILAGIRGELRRHRRRGIRLRTGLPARRICHVPQSSGDGGAAAGFSGGTI